MFRSSVIPMILVPGILMVSAQASSGELIPTKVLVRVVSRDAKVIGSNVGGALVRIINAETGETLAQGRQEGGTGDTQKIMAQPRRRGDTVYGTPGAAFFLAEVPLERPTKVEIRAEAPLAFSHALQSGAKTLILIPGRHIEGEGVVIELDGLIVAIARPAAGVVLKGGEEVRVGAEIRML